MSLKIVLMGTGAFALPTFRHLMEASANDPDAHDVVGVFTQPERTGRGHHRHVNPVRVLGEEHGVPVFQPDRVNDPEMLDALRALNADVFVVAAYGQIMKQVLLDIPRLGAFNLHGSLLPKYRGAAPVQFTIWNGDPVGGVTMFQIEPALDSGPMVGVVETAITADDTSATLMSRLAELSVELTVDVLNKLDLGTADFVDQDADFVTLAPKIQKHEGVIDWGKSAVEIDCHIRAMQPWPKASTWLLLPQRKPLRCILQGATVAQASSRCEAGTVIDAPDGSSDLHIVTGDGVLAVSMIQPEGKKPMDAAGFANGYLGKQTARFGSNSDS
ncbi:MAG: methionyl-tRNA formyltransferase [Fuerstiella sp.]